MGKTYASVEIGIPASKCYCYVKNSLKDPKFIAIYKTLHRGREYSGRIVEDTQNCRLVIEESGIEPLTGMRIKGWTITYEFQETGNGKTRVAISVEYGIFLAFMGMATIKLQSINEVLGRITSLLALEYNENAGRREPNVVDKG